VVLVEMVRLVAAVVVAVLVQPLLVAAGVAMVVRA
jgi:hypothetical protein